MSHASRFPKPFAAFSRSALAAACVAAFVPTSASAQQPAANRGVRPAPQPMQVSVELDKILDVWEAKSAIFQTLQGTHDRYLYQPTIGREVRATGRYFFEKPDKGRIDLESVEIQAGAVSSQKDAHGNPLRLMSADPEIWVCDSTQILGLSTAFGEKQYSRVEIPPHLRGENVADGPLPFLFGVSADKMKARYRLQLGPQHSWSEGNPTGQVHVIAFPTRATDAQNWQRAEVLLEGKHFFPTAIRLRHGIGPSADQTVYVFNLKEVSANQAWRARGMRALLPMGFNPFAPSLRGFKLLENHQAQPQQAAGGAMRPGR